MLRTNIKGLPDGRKYMTEFGYSQCYCWTVIKETPKTKTLARVHTKSDPDWKPKSSPGGFAGHVYNQQEQTWLFDEIDFDQQIKVRMTKKGWALGSHKFREDVAREFYDYNF